MLLNKKKSLLTVIAVSIIMSIIRAAVILGNIESKDLGSEIYFLDESAAVYSFAAVTLAFVILFFILAFKLGKKRACSFPANTCSVNVASIICGFALLGESIIYLTFAFSKQAPFGGLDIAVIVFSFISSVYFFFVGFAGHHTNSSLIAIGALMPIFTAVFRLLADFVRQSAIPLASSGAYNILSIIFLMLFLLAEGKTLAGVGNAFMLTLTGYCSILFLMIYSLPNLLIHSFWLPNFNYITAFSIVDLCFVIYISIRLFTVKIGEAGSMVTAESIEKVGKKSKRKAEESIKIEEIGKVTDPESDMESGKEADTEIIENTETNTETVSKGDTQDSKEQE